MINIPPLLSEASGWPWEAEHNLTSKLRGISELPMVSVVTPSYNQGEFLEATIRSVLLQGYPNLEYIIIDGGSTDNSIEIIRKYAPWLSYWVSEPDKGQSDAINKGFEISKGEIFAWLNSDDYYFPQAIWNGVLALTESDCRMVYGDCLIEYLDEGLIKRKVVPEFSLRELYFRDFIWQPATFFYSDVIDDIGGLDNSLNWAMDWDLWIRIGRKFKIKKTDHILAVARFYKDNKTLSGDHERFYELINVLTRHKIFNRKLVFFVIQYIIRRIESFISRFPFLHKVLFDLPHDKLVNISKFFKRCSEL